MLTGDAIDVHEAHRLGMVSKVFPVDDLSERTLAYARRIAQLPTMSALLIKESVNQTVDNMGFYNSLQACFTLHQLNHSHWAEIHESKYPVAEEQDQGPEPAGGASGPSLGEGPGGGTRGRRLTPGDVGSTGTQSHHRHDPLPTPVSPSRSGNPLVQGVPRT